MTVDQARACFNQVRDEQAARGDHDAVAQTEILREWFCNDQFRRAVSDMTFAQIQERN